jgi:membrane associated rhomboid family serine protease
MYVCTILTILAFLADPVAQILIGWFACVPDEALFRGHIWTLFTYAFIHGGIWHLAVNMLGLYFFGRRLEEVWPEDRYLKVGLLAAVFAALLHCVGSYGLLLIGASPTTVMAPMVGASGIIFALMTIAAVQDPDSPLILLPFPIAVPLKYFVIIIGLLTLLSVPKSGGVAHLAHLGGMIVGYYAARYPDWLDRLPWPGRRRRRGPEIHYGGRGMWRKL